MAFTKEAAPQPPAQVAGDRGLKKNALGTRDIVFMLVSAAAPLTIVVGIAPLALAVGGPGAPVIYIAAAVALALFAIGFMALTRHVTSFSGFYGYISQTLGRVIGLGSGLTAWMSYNGLQIGLYGLLGIQASLSLKSLFHLDVPWWVCALVAIAAVWYLGWRGIEVGARVVAVLLSLETIIVVIIAVVVIAKGGAHGISMASFDPKNVFNPGMAAVLTLGFSAFMGFEAGALYREEARNPDKTVPRATYISIAFIGLFYAFSVWIIVNALGADKVQAFAAGHLNAGDTAYIVAAQYVGPWCEMVMSVLIVTSIFASQLAFHNTINRYTLSLSREGIFPAWAGRISPRHLTPSTAGVVQTVLAVALVAIFAALKLDPFTQFVIWVNTPGVLGILILQALTGIGVIGYFLRHRSIRLRWYVMPSAVVSLVVMLVVIWLFIQNAELFTGAPAGPPLNTVLIVIAPAVLVAGVVWGLVLRRRRPAAYERIGTGD